MDPTFIQPIQSRDSSSSSTSSGSESSDHNMDPQKPEIPETAPTTTNKPLEETDEYRFQQFREANFGKAVQPITEESDKVLRLPVARKKPRQHPARITMDTVVEMLTLPIEPETDDPDDNRISGPPAADGMVLPTAGWTVIPIMEEFLKKKLNNVFYTAKLLKIDLIQVNNYLTTFKVPEEHLLSQDEGRIERAFQGSSRDWIKKIFSIKVTELPLGTYARLHHVIFCILKMVMYGSLNAFKSPRRMGYISGLWTELIEKTSVEVFDKDGKPAFLKRKGENIRVRRSPLAISYNIFRYYEMVMTCYRINYAASSPPPQTLQQTTNTRSTTVTQSIPRDDSYHQTKKGEWH